MLCKDDSRLARNTRDENSYPHYGPGTGTLTQASPGNRRPRSGRDNHGKEALEGPDKLGRVDVALVCHRLPDATARKVIRLFHERHPEGKVVYIVHIYGEWPEVEADRYVVGADGPDALLRVIGETGPQAVA